MKNRTQVLTSLNRIVAQSETNLLTFRESVANTTDLFNLLRWKVDNAAIHDWAGRWAQDLVKSLAETTDESYPEWLDAHTQQVTARLVSLAGKTRADDCWEIEGTKAIHKALVSVIN